MVGYERKNLHDLVASMRSKRLSGHQLPGLLDTYQVVYLVVEGILRAGGRGAAETWVRKDWVALTTGSQPILYREIDHYLATLTHLAGVTVVQTSNPTQTAAMIASRYRWWLDKEWAQHRSHIEIYAPADIGQVGRGRILRRTVGLVEKVAAQLPGLDRGAWSVGKHFGNVYRMVNAEVREWAGVRIETEGARGKGSKRLGEARAERIWNELRGGK